MKNWLPFEEAREIVIRDAKEHGIDSRRTWYGEYVKKHKPLNIPSCPSITYKYAGWKGWAYWLNTNNQRYGKKYKQNDRFFSKWSPDMAYILGLWFADGCISVTPSSYVFSIGLCERDKCLLENILKKIKSNHPLYRSSKDSHVSFSIRITSKGIGKDILRLGGKERKSLSVEFPYVPKKYLSDFIRGLWDGDGCFKIKKCKIQPKSLRASFVSGSRKFVLSMIKILKKQMPLINPRFHIDDKNKKRKKYYRIYFGKKDAIVFGDFLYNGLSNLKMNRKYQLYKMVKNGE